MTTFWPDGTPKSMDNAFSGPARRAALAQPPAPSRFSSTGMRKHRRVNPTPAQTISLPGSHGPKARGVL